MEFTNEFIDSLCVDEAKIIEKISKELDVSRPQVKATVGLIKDGNTIPFISRYRKEVTGSLDEVAVRDISHRLSSLENLEARRIEIVRAVFNQGKLTDELFENINKCETLSELEDIYAPFKKKKKTRGMIAMEKGLEPLADKMVELNDTDIEKLADSFIDTEKGVEDRDGALAGAMDIIAEKVSQEVDLRREIIDFIINHGEIVITGKGDKDKSVYGMYYDYRESLKTLKPHRVLAINRGEKEGELEIKIELDNDKTLAQIESKYEFHNAYHKLAVSDSYKRLLLPSVLREIRSSSSETADSHGIKVFADNLKNLLYSPPIRKTRVMGIDPGIRTGSKAVALDETGKFLDGMLFYQNRADEAIKKITDFAVKHKIELIAVGNGTGSYEVQQIVSQAISERGLNLHYTIVSEDGASVYSASPLAGEEFPDLDLTVRGAISIARRLQDPLSELVKIDPKSIGVGLYQHDVNQKALGETLSEVVESVVNNVGVNLNTASYALLRYVSGVSIALAKNIVKHRDNGGQFKSRDDLRKVSGMGDKTFEQCAGFLKIPESDNPLDNTWVHPENYGIASEIYDILKKDGKLERAVREELKRKHGVGDTTINDIVSELKKPNRDPREDFPAPILQKGVVNFEDLKNGMRVNGKVKNVVDFGAFVDIGIKETALLHISEMSDRYIKNPSDIVKAGDVISAVIIGIDKERKRISLSMKTQS
jgi:uncharacterized protein